VIDICTKLIIVSLVFMMKGFRKKRTKE